MYVPLGDRQWLNAGRDPEELTVKMGRDAYLAQRKTRRVQVGAGAGGPSYAKSLAVSAYACHAIKNDGTLWSWGWNVDANCGIPTQGNTGDEANDFGVSEYFLTPEPSPLTGIVKVSCGAYYSMGLDDAGAVYVWGSFPAVGNVSDGTIDELFEQGYRTLMTAGVIDIYAGTYNQMFYRMDDGKWYAAGKNVDGVLGRGFSDDLWYSDFEPMNLPDNITKLEMPAQNDNIILALSDAGDLYAWGSERYGESGLGNPQPGWVLEVVDPTRVDIDGVVDMSIGGEGFAALALEDGRVFGQGQSYLSCFGIAEEPVDTGRYYTTPTYAGIDNVRQVECGPLHSVALKRDGTVWSTGYDDDHGALDVRPYGALGYEIEEFIIGHRYVQKGWRKVDLAGVESIAVHGFFGGVVKENCTVWTFGGNSRGRVGNDTRTIIPLPWEDQSAFVNNDARMPTLVIGGHDILPFGASSLSTLGNGALAQADPEMWAWGDGKYGQLGTGTAEAQKAAVKCRMSS